MTVNIFHLPPKDIKPYIMVPVGYFYNRELYELKPNDRVILLDESCKWYFVDRLEIDIESAAFGFWAKTLYSCGGRYKVTKEAIFSRWDLQAIRYGYNPKVISRQRCLIIELRKENGKSPRNDVQTS